MSSFQRIWWCHFTPVFFFIPSKANPVLVVFTVCNFVVYFTFRLFGIAIAMWLYLYHFYFYSLLCISGNGTAAQHCTLHFVVFCIYTFHIVYSIVGLACREKLSLAIMLNNMKIVKYTCNKFAVLKVSSVCSLLLEFVWCRRRHRAQSTRDKHTHINQAWSTDTPTQTQTHKDFYRMMKKLFHFHCSFGSLKQTRLWTTKSEKKKENTVNSKKFVCYHCICCQT